MPNYAPNKTIWNTTQKKFLREYFHRLTLAELLAQVNTMRKDPATYQELRHQLNRMNLKKFRIIHWTSEQEKYLIENIGIKGNLELATDLNAMKLTKRIFDSKSIQKKIKFLGLKRTTDMLRAIVERHKENKRYPGKVNGAKNGEEKVCARNGIASWHIKVNGSWRKKSVFLWEQHYGKLPPASTVAFIDNNPLNCDISNLELLRKGKLSKERRQTVNRISASWMDNKYNLELIDRVRKQEEKEAIAKQPKAPEANKIKVRINPKLEIWVRPGTDTNAIKAKYATN